MNNKNCFFLTNDDGYRAIGLKYLKKIVKQISNDIWVFDPAKNQSAKSHSITINKNINIKMTNKKEYIISGTPSDCVILGLEKIKNKKKKNILLISGINEGVNLGYAILYSGTVAAAREAPPLDPSKTIYELSLFISRVLHSETPIKPTGIPIIRLGLLVPFCIKSNKVIKAVGALPMTTTGPNNNSSFLSISNQICSIPIALLVVNLESIEVGAISKMH